MESEKFTLQSALSAGRENRIREWIIDFLQDVGSNLKLADGLRENTTIEYSGPVMAPIANMRRTAGSERERLRYVDKDWEENIAKMMVAIRNGWKPQPLIMTDYFDPQGSLTDGNHRCEALRRLGYIEYWTVFLKTRN